MRDEIPKPVPQPTPESLQIPDMNHAHSLESGHQSIFHQYRYEPEKYLRNHSTRSSGTGGEGDGEGYGGQAAAEQASKKHLPNVEVGTFGHN